MILSNVTHLTQLSGKLWWALTHEAIQHCVALAGILARAAVTLVLTDFTVRAHKAWRTLAVVTPLVLLKEETNGNDKHLWCTNFVGISGIYLVGSDWNTVIQTKTFIPCTFLHSGTDRGSR